MAASGSIRRMLRFLRYPLGILIAGLVGSPVAPLPLTVGEWVTVTDRSLEIEAGSPLDFSDLTPPLPDQRMVIAGDRLTFGGSTPAINCATLAPGFSGVSGSGFPDHDTSRRYAEQLRRHGYNLVRFHFIDALLMQGARQDLAFNPEQLDRFQFLMNELSKRHIHWFVDLMSSQNAALGGVFPNRWSDNRQMLLRIFTDPVALTHWKQLATKLLTTPNSYTGTPLALDPHTAGLILVNEDVINMQSAIRPDPSGRFPALLAQPFANWLRVNHLDSLKTFTLPLIGERSAKMELFQRFISARQIATAREMEKTVREIGFDGAVTHADNWAQLNMVPTRRTLALVDMHGYDQVPVSAVPGAVIRSRSSLGDMGRYLQSIGSARFLGRPFIVTEHDQPFWNSYRYESGLAAPTVASLQGWNFICRHADGPIDLAYDGRGLRKDAIWPDGGGLDPVARAGETLTALLWARHEIAPAAASIGLRLDDTAALRDGGWRELPSSIGLAVWLARLGFSDERSPAPTLTVDLSANPTPDVVNLLRAAGTMPTSNLTNPAAGILESPDGGVLLEARERRLRVTTQRTAAIAFDALINPVQIGPIKVESASGPALLALSALDGQPLAHSSRVLAILASDARNTGMAVGANGTLEMLGHLPVQLRRVRVSLTFKGAAGRWTLAPLRLNGQLDGAYTVRSDGMGAHLTLDTTLSRHGPTTFFLLTRSDTL